MADSPALLLSLGVDLLFRELVVLDVIGLALVTSGPKLISVSGTIRNL